MTTNIDELTVQAKIKGASAELLFWLRQCRSNDTLNLIKSTIGNIELEVRKKEGSEKCQQK